MQPSEISGRGILRGLFWCVLYTFGAAACIFFAFVLISFVYLMQTMLLLGQVAP